MVVVAFLFDWLGFLTPEANYLWSELGYALVFLSLTVSPALIYLYFIQTDGIRKTRSKIALISFEIVLYTLTIVVPSVLVYPQILEALLFCVPPFLALLVGLGLKRFESAPHPLT